MIEGDRKFLTVRIMPYFGVNRLVVKDHPSKAKWPDIWMSWEKGVPVIYVTAEWKRQSKDERRKRLVHEVAHAVGVEHGRKSGGLMYSTCPAKDTWSMAVYRDILSGSAGFGGRKFGI